MNLAQGPNKTITESYHRSVPYPTLRPDPSPQDGEAASPRRPVPRSWRRRPDLQSRPHGLHPCGMRPPQPLTAARPAGHRRRAHCTSPPSALVSGPALAAAPSRPLPRLAPFPDAAASPPRPPPHPSRRPPAEHAAGRRVGALVRASRHTAATEVGTALLPASSLLRGGSGGTRRGRQRAATWGNGSAQHGAAAGNSGV